MLRLWIAFLQKILVMPGENSCYAPRLAEEVGKAALHTSYVSKKRERKRDARRDQVVLFFIIQSLSCYGMA